MLRSTLIGALLSVLIANPVLASDFYAKTAGWTIIGDDESCGMYMQFEGPGETQMLFLKYPDGHFGASVLNYNWTAVEGSDYKIRYTLNSSSYNTEHSKGTKSDGASGFISFFNKELESDLVKGSSLHIYLDDTLVDRLSLAGTSAAIAMVNRCLVGVRTKIAAAEREKRRWSDIPKDPFASSTRTNSAPLPRGSPAAWASTNDYPTKALREHREDAWLLLSRLVPMVVCSLAKSTRAAVLPISMKPPVLTFNAARGSIQQLTRRERQPLALGRKQ